MVRRPLRAEDVQIFHEGGEPVIVIIPHGKDVNAVMIELAIATISKTESFAHQISREVDHHALAYTREILETFAAKLRLEDTPW